MQIIGPVSVHLPRKQNTVILDTLIQPQHFVFQILVSQFQMRREEQGGVFLEWTNAMPIDPNDVQLSRVDCDQVVIVVSGCLKATCRRCGEGTEQYK